MKHIAIWLKLTIGFGAVLLLLVISGGISYYYLSDNLDSFTKYRNLAKNANLMGQVQASLLMVRMNVKDFILTGNRKDLSEYTLYMKQTEKFIKEANQDIRAPERAHMVQESMDLIGKYNEEFHAVITTKEQQNELDKVLSTSGPNCERKLTELMNSAKQNNDVTAAYHAGLAIRNLLKGRIYATQFSMTFDLAMLDKIHAEFASFDKDLDVLNRELQNPDRRKMREEAQVLKDEYVTAFEKVAKLILQRNEIAQNKLNIWGPSIAKALDDAKLSVKKDQDILGPLVQANSTHAKKLVGILVAVAVIIGLGGGIAIARGITKPLGIATNFANAVAVGDFNASISIDQRDEVGKICKSLDAIKAAVSNAANEVENVVVRVERGDMKATGNVSGLSGGFANLVDGVNALVGVYSGFCDQIPVGVMTLSKDHKVTYLNATALKMTGTDSAHGKICSDLFNTTDCNSANCASDICMQSKKASSSEASASTAAGNHEVSYTSIPLTTRQGEVVGAAEIVIDQTEIKNAQKTMIQVANRANEIADRVASSSEELSAQVEQINRGAEVQQQRVGETATAMEEMNATVLEVAKNSSLATEQSDNARNMANEGAVLVNKVVEAINQVNGVAQTLQDDMKKLGEQAEAIGGVMTVIMDIADQTNLLALNAAIEAARAGDAGRGFAVVADEVRKLAEKTMAATNEVGENIRAIQNAAETNVENVNNAVKNVTNATELANTSGEALAKIVSMSTESSALISSIATAAEEQSATSEQINGAIEEVNRIVNETTDGMIQSSSAVQELAQMAQELKRVLEGLQQS